MAVREGGRFLSILIGVCYSLQERAGDGKRLGVGTGCRRHEGICPPGGITVRRGARLPLVRSGLSPEKNKLNPTNCSGRSFIFR